MLTSAPVVLVKEPKIANFALKILLLIFQMY
jgi:hypothetical protein